MSRYGARFQKVLPRQNLITSSTPFLHRPVCLMALLILGLTDTTSASGLLSLTSDNDLYSSGDDGHYTNGAEISWGFIPEQDHWTRDFAEHLPGWHNETLGGASYSLAHQMFTPNEISQRDLIEDDRPYAGLLLTGLTLLSDTPQGDGQRTAQTLSFNVGLVGPGAGGKPIQREFHKLIDSEKPRGWSHQLHNEPIVNMTYRRAWLSPAHLGSMEVEYGPHAGFALGNLYTYGAAGGTIRLGQNLDRSFGIPAVPPAENGQSGFLPSISNGWYVFAGLEGRYMAHNLLLDGNTFESSHSVDRKLWVGDITLGAAMMWQSAQLSYTYIWRTKEFKTQDNNDQFGSITLSFWL